VLRSTHRGRGSSSIANFLGLLPNGLKGFFGGGKRVILRAGGCGSTTTSIAHNLGAPFLLRSTAQPKPPPGFASSPSPSNQSVQNALATLTSAEAPARRRRSYVRHLIAISSGSYNMAAALATRLRHVAGASVPVRQAGPHRRSHVRRHSQEAGARPRPADKVWSRAARLPEKRNRS
jgi:hypothetical protein